MDWNVAIEKNREALKRILATLAAMAGLAIGQSPPLWASRPVCASAQSCRAGGTTTGGEGRDAAGGSGDPAGRRAEGGDGYPSSGRITLPRYLHRAVLRLLRPAESAARRLVIVAARDLVVDLPPARPRKPDPKAAHAALRSLGIAVTISPAEAERAAALARCPRAARTRIALPLFDPIRVPRPGRPRTVPPHAAPRILSFDGARPHRLPPPLSPLDPIDATRLTLRLAAVASALDDLPRHAKRFARWRLRRNRGPVRRISPLRPGRPPGLSAANRRRPTHEVHEILADMQYFAGKALEPPDTS